MPETLRVGELVAFGRWLEKNGYTYAPCRPGMALHMQGHQGVPVMVLCGDGDGGLLYAPDIQGLVDQFRREGVR